MSKPRLLIPFSIQFSVRYVVRTGLLDRLREFADPVVLLDWSDQCLERELECAGAEVGALTPVRRGVGYERARSLMNVCHQKRMASPSAAIWERRADLHRTPYHRLRRRLRNGLGRFTFSLPGTERWLRAKEEELFWRDTNARELEKRLNALGIDAALSLTPFLPNEDALMRVAARAGIPLCASILSFDNISTRGWIATPFSRYLVWNSHNAAELRRGYPEVGSAGAAQIVGSPQFDFYWDSGYIWPEDEWRERLALPAGRPVILFGGGFYFCAPHEPRFLSQLDEAIEAGEVPGRPVVLFRNHPVDPIDRWLPVLHSARHVIYDDPSPGGRISGKTNITRPDIEKLASCLYHSRVHVNVASTMAVDGAIFDRPQIGPAYDDTPGARFDRTARELYLQEHYLPITHSGGLEIVRSRNDFIRAVRSGLDDPGRLSDGRKRLVGEICTFDDGQATARVAAAVRAFLNGAAERKP